MRALVIISVLNVLRLVSTYPTARNEPACLVITPARQDQINEIAQKIGEFISNLTNQYDDIDISTVKLNFEKHSDDEEPKETIITVSVNECSDGTEEDETIKRSEVTNYEDASYLDKFGSNVVTADESKVVSFSANDCSVRAQIDETIEGSEVITNNVEAKAYLDKFGADGGIYGEVSITVEAPPTVEDYAYVPLQSCACPEDTKPELVEAELVRLQVDAEQEQLLQALERSRPGPLVLVHRQATDGEELLVF